MRSPMLLVSVLFIVPSVCSQEKPTKLAELRIYSNFLYNIGGSALLSGGTLEFNGNTINGSLMCSDGTVILPGEPTDPAGNTVHGKNTCS